MLFLRAQAAIDEPWKFAGWWGLYTTQSKDGTQMLQLLTSAKRRIRASHSAEGGPANRKSADIWDHHYSRWGDNRRQPIPFGRGIPFRGDMLGSPGLQLRSVWS